MLHMPCVAVDGDGLTVAAVSFHLFGCDMMTNVKATEHRRNSRFREDTECKKLVGGNGADATFSDWTKMLGCSFACVQHSMRPHL